MTRSSWTSTPTPGSRPGATGSASCTETSSLPARSSCCAARARWPRDGASSRSPRRRRWARRFSRSRSVPCRVETILNDRQVIDLTALGADEAYRRLFDGLRAAGLDPGGQFPLGPEAAPVPRPELLRRQGRRHLLRPRGRGAPGDRDADTDAAPGGAASAGGGRLVGQRQVVAGPRRGLADGSARIGRTGPSSTRFVPGPSRSASWPDRCPRHFPRARLDPTGRRSAIGSRDESRAATRARVPPHSCRSVLTEYADDLTMQLGRREASVLLVVDQVEELLQSVAERRGLGLLQRAPACHGAARRPGFRAVDAPLRLPGQLSEPPRPAWPRLRRSAARPLAGGERFPR